MVWQEVSSAGKSVANFNHWPRPANWVKNISVLVCMEQTFIVQIELAFNVAMEFFLSNLLPSPREIERKAKAYFLAKAIADAAWSPGGKDADREMTANAAIVAEEELRKAVE